MSIIYTPPHISIEFDLETEEHVLMATNYLRTTPAGDRLLRARPWPAIQYRHATQEAAEKDAAALREYLANPPKRTRATSEEAVSERSVAGRRGWWED